MISDKEIIDYLKKEKDNLRKKLDNEKKKNWLVEIDIEKGKRIQAQYIAQSREERSAKKALNLT
jgi:3-dehydroquinate synthetase